MGFANLNENFNEAESEKFYVTIESAGINGDEIFINLISQSEGGLVIDEINTLRLKKNIGLGLFVSEAIMIVIDKDEIDDDFVESTFVNPLWDGTDDNEDDITIYGEVDGSIKAVFSNGLECQISVCGDAIKTVEVNVHVMNNPENGNPFVSDEIINAQLDMAKKVLSQACIKLDVSPFNHFTPNINVSDGVLISDAMETEEVRSIIDQVKDISNEQKIDLIFLNEFENDEMTRGISLTDFLFSPGFPYNGDENHKRTSLINGSLITMSTNPFIVGHEIGHILSNNGHYLAESYTTSSNGCVIVTTGGYPDPDFTNPNTNPNNTLIFNLMRPGTSMHNEFFASKRLRQFQLIDFREATNIPQD